MKAKETLLKKSSNKSKPGAYREIVVVLPDIRSSYNVGSMFRTSDGAGVSRIVVSGYTPCPIDKFGRVQGEIAKTALGAEKEIPWVYIKSVKTALMKLKKEGFQIVAIEQDERAVNYRKIKVKEKIAFVFGNEVGGLDKKILALCNDIAEMPMKGKKESLNVSVTAGIALYSILGI